MIDNINLNILLNSSSDKWMIETVPCGNYQAYKTYKVEPVIMATAESLSWFDESIRT